MLFWNLEAAKDHKWGSTLAALSNEIIDEANYFVTGEELQKWRLQDKNDLQIFFQVSEKTS